MKTDDFDKYVAAHTGGGTFIKLKDGESFVCAFVGQPGGREVIWTGSSTEDFDAEKHKGQTPSLKVRWNVFVVSSSTGAATGMKIFEQTPTTYGEYVRQRDKHGLEGKLYEVSRTGSTAKDTKYHVDLERDATDDELAAIAAAEPFDLERKAGEGPEKKAEAPTGAPTDAHDADYINELKDRLKQLPGSAVQDFLSEFGIKRVKDLSALAFAKAENFVSSLEATRDGGGVDPFAD